MDPSTSPIYVGFSGPAGSGKTSTAHALAPGGVRMVGSPVVWDHYSLAKPLYDVVGIKRQTLGDDAKSRILYGIHDEISDLLGRRPDYDDFIELVYDLYVMDAGKDGDPKPRTFLQIMGDMCRKYHEDCFIETLIRRANTEWKDLVEDYYLRDDLPPKNFALISDTRYLNEINKLREEPNFILVRLEASKEVLNERLIERDGQGMTEEQWNHPTETQMNEVPHDYFDFVLNTDEMTLREQALAVRDYLLSRVDMAMEDNKYIDLKVGV